LFDFQVPHFAETGRGRRSSSMATKVKSALVT
jgi:hypothetical protein